MIFQAILMSLLYVFNVFAIKEFYDLKATDIYGMDVDFQKFKGKVLLIVNVASQCGFTDSHYRDLQKMQVSQPFLVKNILRIFYLFINSIFQDILGNDDHFLVLGFPCNQFGQQEPDDNAAIDEFVKTNYNVDFPMFSKIDVRGESISPVWQYLTGKSIRKSWYIV